MKNAKISINEDKCINGSKKVRITKKMTNLFWFCLMNVYNARKINGICKECGETVFSVLEIYIGINPEISAVNKEAPVFFVMCLEMR